MSEKPESEEFDDEEDDGSAVDSDDLDVDHLIADLDKRKKTVVKAGEPAWRRLERIREERQTASSCRISTTTRSATATATAK
jgi:hypothetical protein